LTPGDFASTDGWKQAQPQDAVLRGKWWEMFHDPLLNDLQQQVDAANQTLAQAWANYRAARAAVALSRSQLYPTVTTTPSATRSATGPHATNQFQLPVDASWEVDLWGSGPQPGGREQRRGPGDSCGSGEHAPFAARPAGRRLLPVAWAGRAEAAARRNRRRVPEDARADQGQARIWYRLRLRRRPGADAAPADHRPGHRPGHHPGTARARHRGAGRQGGLQLLDSGGAAAREPARGAAGRAVAAPRAPSGHLRRRAPRRGVQRTDRRGQGRVLPYAHAQRRGGVCQHRHRLPLHAAQPDLGVRGLAGPDAIRRRKAAGTGRGGAGDTRGFRRVVPPDRADRVPGGGGLPRRRSHPLAGAAAAGRCRRLSPEGPDARDGSVQGWRRPVSRRHRPPRPHFFPTSAPR